MYYVLKLCMETHSHLCQQMLPLLINNYTVMTYPFSVSSEEPRPKSRPLPGYGSRSHRSTTPPLREKIPQLITAEDVSEVRGGISLYSLTFFPSSFPVLSLLSVATRASCC